MAQFIMQPQFRNPWVQNLPNMLQNMALQGVAQKFQAKQTAEKQRIYQKEREEQREFTLKRREEVDAWKKNTTLGVYEVSNISGVPKNTTGFFMNQGKIYARTSPEKTPRAPKTLNTTDGILQWDEAKGTWVNTGRKAPDRGTKLHVGKDGSVTLTQGGISSVGELTPTNKNAVQKELMSIDDRMGRLSNIISSYDSSYQNVFTKIGKSYDALKDMTGLGKPLSPKDRTSLQEYTSYRKQAVREFALEIQALGKGNLTKNEEKLYGLGLPNPGKGWFDGDSPAEFERGLKDTYKNLDKVRARKRYYMNRLNYTQKDIDRLLDREEIMSVDSFVKMAEEKGAQKQAEITAQLQASGQQVDQAKVRQMVLEFLRSEFGFSF